MTAGTARVREWSDRFRKFPLAARVVAGLTRCAPEIWRRTFDLLQQESPEYRNSVDEEFTDESRSHCKELLQLAVAIAKGRTGGLDDDPFAFVRTHAEWRARRHVPLIASLHAYRLAHKSYNAAARELLLRQTRRDEALLSLAMLEDFWMEFFDHVGHVLAEAHAVEEESSVAKDTRAYTRLIDDLLRGIEPRDSESHRLCVLYGIRPGAPLAVAVARPSPAANGDRIDVGPALRSVVRLVQQELPSALFGKLAAVRNDEAIAIVCNHANPGRVLAKALRRHRVARIAIGVSRDAREFAELPSALEEARLAFEFAASNQPLMHFSDIDLTEFLIRRTEKTALRLIPEWARALDQSSDLSRTVRAFAECSLNVKQTARQLDVHPNTVYFRLNQIHKMTGTDPRSFSGISLLLTALRMLETHA
jgi:hypothetical protein